jgi:hypothetical protein
VVISKEVSSDIGKLQLGRDLTNQLLLKLHDQLPEADRTRRVPDDDRSFVSQMIVEHAGRPHFFLIVADDTTAPDHLIVETVLHVTLDDL